MRVSVKDVVVISLGLLLGYGLYPMINSESEVALPSTSAVGVTDRSPEVTPHMATDSVNPSTLNQDGTPTISANQTQEHAQSIASSHSNEQNIAPVKEQTVASQSSADLNSQYSEDGAQDINQHILEDWTRQHQRQLEQTLQDNIPARIFNDMLEEVTKDNGFLSEPQIKQEPVADEQWAYNMAQELTDVIQQHELANQLELFSITCKQLTCELVGKELEPGVWNSVFISLFTHILGSGHQLVDGEGRNVNYLDNEVVYFYAQFAFAPD